jgi:RNA polymerase sigma factor (sigma-70 family)
LRLQGDERLVALTRRGQDGAFDALVQRYESRLLAFCRHMLGSREDAEDVLQEVFTAAYNAMLGDERPINVRPWLYRIARNRCLNHLRRPVPLGQDSMDIFERDAGTTTADTVHKREEFRQIVADVQDLPETQKTALLLREIDALSYEQIAEAMDTTVPSVKSLLVRARVSLAEAAEARLLTCAEVRLELGQAAEGLARTTAPVRRHVRGCDRCRVFRSELRKTTRALTAIYPIGPLVLFKKLFIGKLFAAGGGAAGGGAGAGAVGGAGAAGISSAGAVGSSALAGGAGGSFMSAVGGTVASKAAATVAAAAIVTAGAVEVKHASQPVPVRAAAVVTAAPVRQPVALPARPAAAHAKPAAEPKTSAADARKADKAKARAKAEDKPAQPAAPDQATATTPATVPVAAPPVTQEGSGTATLPEHHSAPPNGGTSAPQDQYGQPIESAPPASPPGEPAGSQPSPQQAPAAGEPPSTAPGA